MKSKCHNAEMRVVGDTTKHYVCTECEEPCDAVSAFEVVGTQTVEEQEVDCIAEGLYTATDGIEFTHYKDRLKQALLTAENRAVQEFAISVSEKISRNHIQAGINLINDKAYPETIGINNRP